METQTTVFNKAGRNSFSAYQSWDVHTSDAFELILGLREYYVGSNQYYDSDSNCYRRSKAFTKQILFQIITSM